MNDHSPLVSIVIPFHNLAHNVDFCIRSLLQQNAPGIPYEIIAVDNASSDDTLDKLKSFEPDIRVLNSEQKGAAAARNVGIRHAKGRYVAMTDGDCLADPLWIASYLKLAGTAPSSSILGGPILPRDTKRAVSVFSRHIFDQRKAMTTDYFPYAASGNMFLSRSMLLQLELFDEELVRSHDVDLSWRALKDFSASFLYIPEARVYHDNPGTLRDLFKEGMKHGKGMAFISTRHAEDTGLTHRRRIFDWYRYRQISVDLHRSITAFRDRGPRAAQQRAFNFYWAVFNTGKQISCVGHSLRFLLKQQLSRPRYVRGP